MVPHLAEECWSLCGYKYSLTSEPWPVIKKEYLTEDKVKVVIQINGKRRAEIETPFGSSENDIMNEIKNIKSVNEKIENEKIIKRICS